MTSLSQGFVLDMMHSGVVSQSNLSVEDCITKAVDFLSGIGLEDMETSYYISKDNILTVNFAYTADGITYYPDLVKISVARDDGRIVGAEFLGYLMSHGERTLPEIKETEESVEANCQTISLWRAFVLLLSRVWVSSRDFAMSLTVLTNTDNAP